jgi:hypothetical protein
MEENALSHQGGAVRTATTLLTVLLLAPALIGAQAARPATTPEVFTATAQAKNATAAVSGMLEVRVSRYTPDFDRKVVEEALRLGGYPRFVTAIRNAPDVGQLVLAGGQPYIIRYAREKVEAGGRTIVVVTDRPVLFLGSARADAKPRAGYEVAVVQIQVDGTGRGKGTMAAAARVRPDGDGGVLLDDYAEQPIELANVTRKAS